MENLREKITNIIANNCSRPGFDEYTNSADQILALPELLALTTKQEPQDAECKCKIPLWSGITQDIYCGNCGKPIKEPMKHCGDDDCPFCEPKERIEELDWGINHLSVEYPLGYLIELKNKINELIKFISAGK